MPGEFVHRPVDALEALLARRVRFVVIGGFAAQLHGSSIITRDTDICYARDDDNLERLSQGLHDLHAVLRGAPEDVPFILDARTLKPGDSFTFSTDAGALDCIGTPAGVPGGFDELQRAAEDFELSHLRVRVASLDDLIRMKRAAGRPRDLAMVEELGALRDEIDRRAMEERGRARRGGH